MYLGANEGEQVESAASERLTTIKDSCETFSLSTIHVSKVVHNLGRIQLIETRRGMHGGFLLAKSPNEIRLDYVIRQLEGDEPWIECHNP